MERQPEILGCGKLKRNYGGEGNRFIMVWSSVLFCFGTEIGTWLTRAELAELRHTSTLAGVRVKKYKLFKEKRYEKDKEKEEANCANRSNLA